MTTHENREQKGDEGSLEKWINKYPVELEHYEAHFEGSKKGCT